MPETWDVLIIGGGPAGLRAAEITSAAGWRTALADRMPSVGRKFLVAGRGGLNLTHSEPLELFLTRYGNEPERWASLLASFPPEATRAWARGLGIETFIGSSGRVFPEEKKAAPLLRSWLNLLRAQGVTFYLRHRWIDFQTAPSGYLATFTTPTGTQEIAARGLILACGGASWPQTGSDGAWFSLLDKKGFGLDPVNPSNCGYEIAWPVEVLARAEGLPLKNITVTAGAKTVSGELLITRYGLEGGALYQLGSILRKLNPPEIMLDLKPTFSVELLAQKLKPGGDLREQAVRTWRLNPASAALLTWLGRNDSALELARSAKSLPLSLLGPRPLAEAISSAGGIRWEALNEHLMFHQQPGLFAAGEMLDWDAPTGGYLLQGCLATGTRAGEGAKVWLKAG